MPLLFNANLVKCIKRILPVVKYKHFLFNNNNQAITFHNSKQSVLTSVKYNRTNATKSVIFGFSLLGLFGLDKQNDERKLIDTIKRGLLYLQVSKRLTCFSNNNIH